MKHLPAVNYGELLLKALFEHWPRTYMYEDNEGGEGAEAGPVANQNGFTPKSGNEYFSIPQHTPVIIRFVCETESERNCTIKNKLLLNLYFLQF